MTEGERKFFAKSRQFGEICVTPCRASRISPTILLSILAHSISLPLSLFFYFSLYAFPTLAPHTPPPPQRFTATPTRRPNRYLYTLQRSLMSTVTCLIYYYTVSPIRLSIHIYIQMYVIGHMNGNAICMPASFRVRRNGKLIMQPRGGTYEQ